MTSRDTIFPNAPSIAKNMYDPKMMEKKMLIILYCNNVNMCLEKGKKNRCKEKEYLIDVIT